MGWTFYLKKEKNSVRKEKQLQNGERSSPVLQRHKTWKRCHMLHANSNHLARATLTAGEAKDSQAVFWLWGKGPWLTGMWQKQKDLGCLPGAFLP